MRLAFARSLVDACNQRKIGFIPLTYENVINRLVTAVDAVRPQGSVFVIMQFITVIRTIYDRLLSFTPYCHPLLDSIGAKLLSRTSSMSFYDARFGVWDNN